MDREDISVYQEKKKKKAGVTILILGKMEFQVFYPGNTCTCVPGDMYKDVHCNIVIMKNLKELKFLSVGKYMAKLWNIRGLPWWYSS